VGGWFGKKIQAFFFFGMRSDLEKKNTTHHVIIYIIIIIIIIFKFNKSIIIKLIIRCRDRCMIYIYTTNL